MRRYYDLFGGFLPRFGAETYAVPLGHAEGIPDKHEIPGTKLTLKKYEIDIHLHFV